MTLYQKISKRLKKAGLKRTETSFSKGYHRTWWDGSDISLREMKENLKKFKPNICMKSAELLGSGWDLYRNDEIYPDEPIYWVLTIFKKNKFGKMEEQGIDTTDLF